ncbi:hypothetical protein C8F01DRAFT_1087968 [Mycena amicta]|nr:hypothetical protein C8F01DRAFT_1087968 [Mycena amicta]
MTRKTGKSFQPATRTTKSPQPRVKSTARQSRRKGNQEGYDSQLAQYGLPHPRRSHKLAYLSSKTFPKMMTTIGWIEWYGYIQRSSGPKSKDSFLLIKPSPPPRFQRVFFRALDRYHDLAHTRFAPISPLCRAHSPEDLFTMWRTRRSTQSSSWGTIDLAFKEVFGTDRPKDISNRVSDSNPNSRSAKLKAARRARQEGHTPTS